MNNPSKFFKENLRKLGPKAALTAPEQYNLYLGLAGLADLLYSLNSKLSVMDDIQRRVKHIEEQQSR